MSRVSAVDERYKAAEAVARNGVCLFVALDENGTEFNTCIRAIAHAAAEDGSDLWANVLGAAKSLRWRLAFRPQPLPFNPTIDTAVTSLLAQAEAVRPALGQDGRALLAALTAAARQLTSTDPPVGTHLLETICEIGPADCVVVTDSTLSRGEVGAWLEPLGFRVLSPGMLAETEISADISYAIGPPRLMRTSLVTAPPTPEVSFFIPSWFSDRGLPRTAVSDYADGAIRPRVRIFEVGDFVSEADSSGTHDLEPIEEFAPPAVWGSRPAVAREPGVQEVSARKVLLGGGFAIWMDDGDRIRTLDPSQPAGERLSYTDVTAVEAGTYLVLRLGLTERSVLYEETLRSMGDRRRIVEASQNEWKQALLTRLRSTGRPAAEAELRKAGVTAADQADAWVQPLLARPQRDADFARLLNWLGLPPEPSFSNATEFRRARYRAAARIREQLEDAMASADMEALRRDGYMTLNGAGFADIIATRVLAISPHSEVVARHETREPFADRGGQWLE